MMQFHEVNFFARAVFERAVVKAVITDMRLITVRIPVNNRTSYTIKLYLRVHVRIQNIIVTISY